MKKILVVIFLLLMVGCRVQETVKSDSTSTSTLIERVLVDSVLLRDSIVIRETCDTVFFTKFRTLYKERVRIDTIMKCDTVYTECVVSAKKKTGNSKKLWWLLIPAIALLWKIGVLDLLRSVIMKRIK